MFKKGDTVRMAVGNDRPGIIEQAWKPGSRVIKGGLVHAEAQYLVNWGSVTCYQAESTLVAAETVPNPVVRTAVPSEFPDWTVREYANGKWDATNGPALSPGFDSFPEVMEYLRIEAHPVFAALSPAARSVIAENGAKGGAA